MAVIIKFIKSNNFFREAEFMQLKWLLHHKTRRELNNSYNQVN